MSPFIIGGIIIFSLVILGWYFLNKISKPIECKCKSCLTGDPFFAGEGPCIWRELETYFKNKSEAAKKIYQLNEERGILREKEMEILWKENKQEIRNIQKKIKKISEEIDKQEKIIMKNVEDRMKVLEIIHEIK